MMQVGRLCVKIAGRDARKKCVITEILENGFVMIDGEVRRRKCNMKHLEPLKETIDINNGADHSTVVEAFKKLGIEIRETKPKQSKPKPKQIRKADRKKLLPKEEKKPKKAEDKKQVNKKPEETKTTDAGETKLEKTLGDE